MGLTEWISARGSLIGIIIGYSQCLGSLFSPLDGGAPCLKAQVGLPQLL